MANVDERKEVQETEKQDKPGACTVNKDLIPAKAVSFLLSGSHSAFNPFLALHMRHIGLNSSETGVIGSALPFMGCITGPFVGALADKYQKHKAVSIFCVITTAVFFVSLLSVPSNIPEEGKPRLVCTGDILDNSTKPKLISASSSLYNVSDKICSRKAPQIDFCLFPQDSDVNSPHLNNASFDCLKSDRYDKAHIRINNITGYNMYNEFADLSVCKIKNPNKTRSNNVLDKVENNSSYFRICSENASVMCVCHISVRQAAPPFGETFGWFFALYALGSTTVVPFYSLYDAMVYAILGEDWTQWGRQRTWGGLGNMLAGLGTSVLLDALYSDYSNINYAVCFYIFGAGMLLIAVCMCFFRVPNGVEKPNILRGSIRLFKSFATIALFINVTVFGIYLGAAGTFMYWHVMEKAEQHTDVKSIKQMIVGLTISLDGLCEIPIFFFSGRLIAKLGHIPTLGVVSVAYTIRFLSYSFIVNPWYIILTAPLNALSFGLTEAIMTSYANLVAPPGLDGLSQSVVTSLHDGLGCGLGALITGFLFSAIGGDWTFRMYAGTSVVFMIPFLIFQWLVIHGHVTIANHASGD